MGKTLFKDMLANYVDKYNSDWEKQFRQLEIFKYKEQSEWKCSSLVLDLSFEGLNHLSFEDFQTDLNKYVNTVIMQFSNKYALTIKIDPKNAIVSLQNLIDQVKLRKEKVSFVVLGGSVWLMSFRSSSF